MPNSTSFFDAISTKDHSPLKRDKAAVPPEALSVVDPDFLSAPAILQKTDAPALPEDQASDNVQPTVGEVPQPKKSARPTGWTFDCAFNFDDPSTHKLIKVSNPRDAQFPTKFWRDIRQKRNELSQSPSQLADEIEPLMAPAENAVQLDEAPAPQEQLPAPTRSETVSQGLFEAISEDLGIEIKAQEMLPHEQICVLHADAMENVVPDEVKDVAAANEMPIAPLGPLDEVETGAGFQMSRERIFSKIQSI